MDSWVIRVTQKSGNTLVTSERVIQAIYMAQIEESKLLFEFARLMDRELLWEAGFVAEDREWTMHKWGDRPWET